MSVLIGLLAIYEGYLLAGEAPDNLTDRFRDRFVRHGLLVEDGTEEQFRQAINDMNHRLRYALGEERPPPPHSTSRRPG